MRVYTDTKGQGLSQEVYNGYQWLWLWLQIFTNEISLKTLKVTIIARKKKIIK